MGRRKTRYDDGGIVPGDGVQDFDPDELAKAKERDLSKEIREMQEARSSEGSEPIYSELGDEAKGIRRNTETGETYYTDKTPVKTEPAKAAPKVKAATGSGRSAGRGGPTAAEMAKYYADQKPSKAEIPSEQAATAPKSTGESTSGMSNFEKLTAGIPFGMGATRFLQAGARGLANVMRAREAAKNAPSGAKQIGEGRRMIESPGAFKRKELEAKREERAERRSKDVRRGIRQKTDDSGAIRLAKGGSASSRADGCAVRGKTRGKMY